MDVNLRGAAEATSFVSNINYNAKGQRELIVYGNGAETNYEYDQQTFRLTKLTTTRSSGLDGPASQIFIDPAVVQDLRYIYDPAGNIARIEDAALSTVFYNGQQIDPVCNYTYDAVYRLIEAQGREHIGQTSFDFAPMNGNCRDYPFAGNIAAPNDLQALRNYIERYEYDSVGNFNILRHLADSGSWTRAYEYNEDSLLEAGNKSNRLTKTTIGNGINQIESYTYDVHGNMTSMPHLTAMIWDFEDQLQQVDLGGGGIAYYVYDASGQRVRKVIESQTGVRRKERIYIGGYEVYREYNGDVSLELERETLHIMDDKQHIALIETQIIENGNLINNPTPLQRYQLGNHLGSASLELTKNGEMISYEEYHPYGATAFQAGRSAAEVSLKRYRYTGKERDEENGLYYYGARYYASWLGRWCSCDPAEFVDGFNIYLFVDNNPIKYFDSTGFGKVKALSVIAKEILDAGGKIGRRHMTHFSRFAGKEVTTKMLREAKGVHVSEDVLKAVDEKFPGLEIPYNQSAMVDFTKAAYKQTGKNLVVKEAVDIGKFVDDGQDIKNAWEKYAKQNALSTEELEQLQEAYTMHHDYESGKMIMVDADVHAAFRHTGGNALNKAGIYAIGLLLALLPRTAEANEDDEELRGILGAISADIVLEYMMPISNSDIEAGKGLGLAIVEEVGDIRDDNGVSLIEAGVRMTQEWVNTIFMNIR